MGALPYYLGLPAWADTRWRGRYFAPATGPLAAYRQIFNTVEGNTSFYQIPSVNMVAGWRAAVTGSGFRFCFKLPRSVTHQSQPDATDLLQFLRVIEPLGENLGPLLIQLPERIGVPQLDWIDRLCAQLPGDYQHVLEVRQREFFQQPERLEPILARYRLGRVIMDTRALFEGDRDHPEAQDALRKKPDLPIVDRVYNDLFFLRLILHPDRREHRRYMMHWAQRVAGYIAAGDTCYVMIHCANNVHAPPLAAEFHTLLQGFSDGALADLPRWPVPQQGGLF